MQKLNFGWKPHVSTSYNSPPPMCNHTKFGSINNPRNHVKQVGFQQNTYIKINKCKKKHLKHIFIIQIYNHACNKKFDFCNKKNYAYERLSLEVFLGYITRKMIISEGKFHH